MSSLFFFFSLFNFFLCEKVYDLKMPLRLQWNENHGYCGETSLISDGLKYGQYFSQYDMRVIADRTPSSDSQTNSELLLGVNDEYAAESVRLNSDGWDNQIRNTKQFLVWIKQRVAKGHLVTIGVYTNEYLFYGNTNPSAGDPDYDHIVSVTKVTSKYNDTTNYYGDDILSFSDHGLWAPIKTGPIYVFNYTFDAIQGTRKQANARKGNIYTLPNDQTIGNYGLDIFGPVDGKNELVPVALQTNLNYEEPEIGKRSNTRPPPMDLQLTITISNLEKNVSYNLYQYNNEKNVPTQSFNKNSAKATKTTSIRPTSNTYSFTQKILSSDKIIFRCVKADAS